MTMAEELITKYRNQGGCPHWAKVIDRDVSIDRHGDGHTFYHFTDGSVVGTKGRGSHHQIWIVGRAVAL